MTLPFPDRAEAGRQLAARLAHLAGRHPLLVLGLPRGGVPVAFEVARALQARMDVLVVRKLGLPGQEELAMGAIASGGVRVVNADVVGALGVPLEVVDAVAEREREELVRRERAFRGQRAFPSVQGATVIVVDDGVATGSTMLAGIRALRQQRPSRLVAAAPVMSVNALRLLESEADECVTLATPEPFGGVGAWYADFRQTSDAEVVDLLGRASGPNSDPEVTEGARTHATVPESGFRQL